MTGIVGAAARRAGSAERRIDPDVLLDRVAAVQRFLRGGRPGAGPARLVPGHTVVERAGDRLALSRDHTVVALAGATGSGKSSLFNALARMDLSPVGVRRPTTGVAHACVWGPLEGATRLLDWVGVLPRHRFVRESPLDAEDEATLHGLVLLDLPDFDSVQHEPPAEVDRLLGLVDLVVWVVDPQKYADRVMHDSYLREFHRHRDVTVVVLNQADRLPAERGAPGAGRPAPAARRRRAGRAYRCWPPRRWTAGLAGCGRSWSGGRRAAGRAAPARRRHGRRGDRLATDDGAGAAGDDPTGRACRDLTEALAGAAGVPAVVEAAERAYRHRAAAPPAGRWSRGWRRLRPDPLRRLHLPGRDPRGAGGEPGRRHLGARPDRGAAFGGRPGGPRGRRTGRARPARSPGRTR